MKNILIILTVTACLVTTAAAEDAKKDVKAIQEQIVGTWLNRLTDCICSADKKYTKPPNIDAFMFDYTADGKFAAYSFREGADGPEKLSTFEGTYKVQLVDVNGKMLPALITETRKLHASDDTVKTLPEPLVTKEVIKLWDPNNTGGKAMSFLTSNLWNTEGKSNPCPKGEFATYTWKRLD